MPRGGAHTTLAGVKASAGHLELAAGLIGLMKLHCALRRVLAAPNAQLRALNPHVGGALRGAGCGLCVQLARLAAAKACSGGVSSFGFAGTIAHAVLRH